MKIGVSYLMGMDKLVYLRNNMKEFYKLRAQVYFIGNNDGDISKDNFDILFLDIDERGTTKYLYEYDSSILASTKIVNLTSKMLPSEEYETNCMISTNEPIEAQLKDIFSDFDSTKYIKMRVNKRWTKSEIEDIKTLSRYVDFKDFSDKSLAIFKAKHDEVFTTAEYLFYTKLVEYYILENRNIIFPRAYMPINGRFLGRKREIITYISEQNFVNNCNQLIKDVLKVIDLNEWPEKLKILLTDFGSIALKKKELLLIYGLINCIYNKKDYLFVPEEYLPLSKSLITLSRNSLEFMKIEDQNKYTYGIINLGDVKNIKVYAFKKTIDETLILAGKNVFTGKEKDNLEEIAEKIDKNLWDNNVIELLDLSYKVRPFSRDEYNTFIALTDIYIKNYECAFIPKSYIPKYIYDRKIRVNNREVKIYDWESYNTEIKQKMKRNNTIKQGIQ